MTTYNWQSSASSSPYSSSPSPSSTSALSPPPTQLKAGLSAPYRHTYSSIALQEGERDTSMNNMFAQTRSFPATATATGARPRTAQACDKCRTRKAKCSGDHPSCKRCLTRGLDCVYATEGRGTRNRTRKTQPAQTKRKNGTGAATSLSTGSSPTFLQPLTIPSLPSASSEPSTTRNSSPSSIHSAPPITRKPQMTHLSSNDHCGLTLPNNSSDEGLLVDSPTYSDHDLPLFLPHAPPIRPPSYHHSGYEQFNESQHYSPLRASSSLDEYTTATQYDPTPRSSLDYAYPSQQQHMLPNSAAFVGESQEFAPQPHYYSAYSSSGHYRPTWTGSNALDSSDTHSMYQHSHHHQPIEAQYASYSNSM